MTFPHTDWPPAESASNRVKKSSLLPYGCSRQFLARGKDLANFLSCLRHCFVLAFAACVKGILLIVKPSVRGYL